MLQMMHDPVAEDIAVGGPIDRLAAQVRHRHQQVDALVARWGHRRIGQRWRMEVDREILGQPPAEDVGYQPLVAIPDQDSVVAYTIEAGQLTLTATQADTGAAIGLVLSAVS